jgi:large subunit ribosomal protein L7A
MVLENLRNSKKTIGVKQTAKAIENGLAKTVFIAEDAEESVVASLKNLCRQKEIEIVNVENMKQLGKACGIEVGAAAVGLLKDIQG